MTGYGIAAFDSGSTKYTVEIKSLNSKFLELSLRLPRIFSDKEFQLRNECNKQIERGKVNLSITIEQQNGIVKAAGIDTALLKNYYEQLKAVVIIIILYSVPCYIYAQNEFSVNGVIYKKNGPERIAQATITNLENRLVMMSDELGSFSIKVKKGDTLLFNKTGYTQQKVVILNANDMLLYMQPVVQLQQVSIKAQSKRQELNDVVNIYRSKGLYFDGRPPWWIFNPISGSPITGFYELFGRDAKNERHFIKYSKNEMEATEVNRRYNKQLVKTVTALPDTVLDFIERNYIGHIANKLIRGFFSYHSLLQYVINNIRLFHFPVQILTLDEIQYSIGYKITYILFFS